MAPLYDSRRFVIWIPVMKMSVGERDKRLNEMASIAADEFCVLHTDPSVSDASIRNKPEWYLEHTVPYLTVRALHFQRDILQRHEAALARHEAVA